MAYERLIKQEEKSDWIDFDPHRDSCDTCLVQASCERRINDCVFLSIRTKNTNTTLYGQSIVRIRYKVIKDTEILTDILYDIKGVDGSISSCYDIIRAYW